MFSMDIIPYSNIIGNLSEGEYDQLKFPRSYKERRWYKYLGRMLTDFEGTILQNFSQEKVFNQSIVSLHNNCMMNNLRVSSLTNMYGNCLFESLMYHGIGTDVKNFRKGLASLLYFYKDIKNFIPNTDMTLEEMFVLWNEIEYVCCYTKPDTENRYYKYSYNIMCQDLSNADSWTKLPTEFLLRVISHIYSLRIIIVGSTSDYLITIESTNPKDTIYLGHLGESHYVAVDRMADIENFVPLFYKDSRKAFIKWAQAMEEKVVRKYYSRKICPEIYDDTDYYNQNWGNNMYFANPSLLDNSSDVHFF